MEISPLLFILLSDFIIVVRSFIAGRRTWLRFGCKKFNVCIRTALIKQIECGPNSFIWTFATMMMGTGLAFGLLIFVLFCGKYSNTQLTWKLCRNESKMIILFNHSVLHVVSSAMVDKRPKLLVPDVMQSTRIVGGVAAKRGEFKGQVSITSMLHKWAITKPSIDEGFPIDFKGVPTKSASVACLWRHTDRRQAHRHCSPLQTIWKHYRKYGAVLESIIPFQSCQFDFAVGLCDGRWYICVQNLRICYQTTSNNWELCSSSYIWWKNIEQWYCHYKGEHLASREQQAPIIYSCFTIFSFLVGWCTVQNVS